MLSRRSFVASSLAALASFVPPSSGKPAKTRVLVVGAGAAVPQSVGGWRPWL